VMMLFLHGVSGGSGAIGGFLHPILGLDHLLAMVTVGLLSAQLGGRAIWSVPTTFVSVMAVGGGLGVAGLEMPITEYAIAASVAVLGMALLARRRIPEFLAMASVGLFALFHGFAHGKEIPRFVDDVMFTSSYMIGFLVATAGLHVVGALVGYIALRSTAGAVALRLVGLAVAAVGFGLLVGAGS
jgi:urease accessory protein